MNSASSLQEMLLASNGSLRIFFDETFSDSNQVTELNDFFILGIFTIMSNENSEKERA